MLDLTPIMNNPKVAVHLPTEAQAKQFFYYMKEHYPEKVTNWPRGPQWEYGEMQCYAAYFPGNDLMRQASMASYEARGFDIVEFDRLIRVKELPIEQSDMDLCSMLGL